MTPTESGLAWRIEIQNASRVCPESVRRLSSVKVTEIMSGSAHALLVEDVLGGDHAPAFAFSVSKIVSNTQQVGAAVEEAADLLGVGGAHLVEASRRGRPGRSTSGEIESVRFVGPIEPDDEARPRGVAARSSRRPRGARRARPPTFIS